MDVRTVNEHIKKIYSDSKLVEDSTIRNFRIVQTEGSRQMTRDIGRFFVKLQNKMHYPVQRCCKFTNLNKKIVDARIV